MKKQLKGAYLIVSSFIITLLALPLGLAKHFGNRVMAAVAPPEAPQALAAAPVAPGPAPAPAPLPILPASSASVYDSLHLGISGLSRPAYELARKGLNKLIQQGRVDNDSIVSIIDFSQPSSHKRLFVLDLRHYKVLFNTLVAHGRNTGKDQALHFSNRASSYMSSPGFYITRDPYMGHNGLSLKLDGLEPGINDNAFNRAIVLHGADYVSDAFVRAQGYIGRSEGCPAVPVVESMPIINAIKSGTCLFIYHPSYVRQSRLLN